MTKQPEPVPGTTARAVPVLVTRPRAQAERFAAELAQRFGARVRPLVAPLMAPEYLAVPVPDARFAAVIFTSAEAVRAARALGTALPRTAYCVGRATAAAAQAAGFDARSADGNVTDLIAMITVAPENGTFLYLRGVDTVGDLEKDLISNDISVVSLQVYLQNEIPFSGECLALLRRPAPVIVPLFSPRSAQLFQAAIPDDTRADLRLAVMSTAVAAAAVGIPRAAVAVAKRPDSPSMLDAVESLLVALAPP